MMCVCMCVCVYKCCVYVCACAHMHVQLLREWGRYLNWTLMNWSPGYIVKWQGEYKLLMFNPPSCVWLCDPMDWSTPGLFVPHHLPKLGKFMSIALVMLSSHLILWRHLLEPFAFNLSQYQGLFQWVSCLRQMTKILELQLQSFQRIFRVDLP